MVIVNSTTSYPIDNHIDNIEQTEEQGDHVQIQEINVHSGRRWSIIQLPRRVKEVILNSIQRARENNQTIERDLIVPNERTINCRPNLRVIAATTLGLLILSGFVLIVYGMFCIVEGGPPCTKDITNFKKAQSNGEVITIFGTAVLLISVKLLDVQQGNDF